MLRLVDEMMAAALLFLIAHPQILAGTPAVQPAPDARSTQTQITELYRQQDRVQSFSQVALSPDGSRIAWGVDGVARGTHRIYIAHLQHPGLAVRINSSVAEEVSCWEHDPVWSKNSQELAYLSDCLSPGQAQLFVATADDLSAPPRQLTHLTGSLSHPQWSPDGAAIGFLFVDHASRAPTPMAAENKVTGVIDDLQNTDVQRLAVTNLRSNVTEPVTPAGLYVFEYDWSPDGHAFALTASPPPGDDNWYVAQLYTQPYGSGRASPLKLYRPRWQIAVPRWSPDGETIAFIEGLMSDEGGTGGEIYTIARTGGVAHDLTPGRRSTPAWFTWLSNREMLFTEFAGGSTSIGALDVEHATARTLWTGAETIRSGPDETSLSVSASKSGALQMALIRNSWSMLPEVWAGPVGGWQQLTFLNADRHLPLPKFSNVVWPSDRFQVQGWLLFPSDFDPARKYPLLVAVHGGPAWIARPEWRAADFNTTLFTSFGYFVFYPNARGSYGQGEAFTQANRRDWGFGDLRDMLAGVDAVAARYPVDRSRIGIMGWSYGGSTAMMAITQTNRFRAAVAGAGAGNWQSYYGQNAIDKWMIPYFGASVYDDPAAYARCSALTYIRKAKTPTLVLVGERDGEAPPAQSIEFWHALKELAVPTRLVIYADEGHSFHRQEDQIDVTIRTLEWFDQHMPAP